MPCKELSLSIVVPLGNLEGIRLLGLLRENDSISGFISWTQRTLKILSLGAIWDFGKGTGLYWADTSLWGAKDPSIRPRCIGTVKAGTQCNSIYLRCVHKPDGRRPQQCSGGSLKSLMLHSSLWLLLWTIFSDIHFSDLRMTHAEKRESLQAKCSLLYSVSNQNLHLWRKRPHTSFHNKNSC